MSLTMVHESMRILQSSRHGFTAALNLLALAADGKETAEKPEAAEVSDDTKKAMREEKKHPLLGKSLDEQKSMDWKELYPLIPKKKGKKYKETPASMKKFVQRYLKELAEKAIEDNCLVQTNDFQHDLEQYAMKVGVEEAARLVVDRRVTYTWTVVHAQCKKHQVPKPTYARMNVHKGEEICSLALHDHAVLMVDFTCARWP